MLSKTTALRVLAFVLTFASVITTGQDSQLSLPERVANLKATFAASQANLRQYEWIETTVVSLKGEEKSRTTQRCFYGADGALQKVIVDAPPPPDAKRGLRGKIIAKKTADLTDYMNSAVTLIKTYLPPDPARIQMTKDAGKVSIQVVEPGKRVRVNFRDYQKPGDNLAIGMDITKSVVTSVEVSSYLDAPTDVVTLEARMGQLNDGTIYTSDITLNAAVKNITVRVHNSGYRKTT